MSASTITGIAVEIDLLAIHPAVRVLLVVEIKTRLLDAQDVIGRLDVKRSVALPVARRARRRVEALSDGRSRRS